MTEHTTHPPLSDLQKRRLAERGYTWIQTIKRLNKLGNAIWANDASQTYAVTLDALHLLSLALEHLDTCVEILNQADETLPGDAEFRDAWQSISALRHAREHEENYIAGRGRYPDRFDPGWVANGYFESNSLTWGEEGILSMSFMGKTYPVRTAIVAALELEAAIFALYDPPIGKATIVVMETNPEATDIGGKEN
jgi:hypothetical protein